MLSCHMIGYFLVNNIDISYINMGFTNNNMSFENNFGNVLGYVVLLLIYIFFEDMECAWICGKGKEIRFDVCSINILQKNWKIELVEPIGN